MDDALAQAAVRALIARGAPTRALREELGAIGRGAEWTMSRACGGPAPGPHRGALWVTGLLVAAAALAPDAPPRELPATAKRIAAHPDRRAPRRPLAGLAGLRHLRRGGRAR